VLKKSTGQNEAYSLDYLGTGPGHNRILIKKMESRLKTGFLVLLGIPCHPGKPGCYSHVSRYFCILR